jgi:hypothetical protein
MDAILGPKPHRAIAEDPLSIRMGRHPRPVKAGQQVPCPREFHIPVPTAAPFPLGEPVSVRFALARSGRFRLGRCRDLGIWTAERPPEPLSRQRSLSGPGDLADLVPRFGPRKKAGFRSAALALVEFTVGHPFAPGDELFGRSQEAAKRMRGDPTSPATPMPGVAHQHSIGALLPIGQSGPQQHC